MTNPKKILAIIAVSLIGLAGIAVVGFVLVLRSQWFRDFARREIISSLEDSTGGKVEMQSFRLDWRRGAEITGLAIHGTEPAGTAPLLTASTVILRMRLFPVWSRPFVLDYLGIDGPLANIIVYGDGKTNIPTPRAAKHPSGNALANVVDLAIRDFEIRDGAAQFSERRVAFSARGRNLRAQLIYNAAALRYQGQISMSPLILASGNHPPLNVRIILPLDLERDRIGITHATFDTAQSSITLNAALQHLASPEVTADLIAQVALSELIRSFDAPIRLEGRGPQSLDIQAGVQMNDRTLEVRRATLALGRTQLELTGALRNRSGASTASFRADLSLDELGPLLQLPAEPRGEVHIVGNAGLTEISGQIEARDLSLRAGNSRLTGIGLASAFKADPKIIEVNSLKLSAFGGELAAQARIEDLAALTIKSNLSGLRLQSLAKTGYAGIVSGTVDARGNLKSPGGYGIDADVRLSLAPGVGGIPVSGHVAATYTGAQGLVSFTGSQVSLPHTRIDLSGILGKQAEIQVTSSNLNDFLPALALAYPSMKSVPLTLAAGGSANVTVQATGSLRRPQVSSHLSMTNFEAGNRKFDRLEADLSASSSGANLQNAVLSRDTLRAEFSASVGLHDWSATPDQPLAVNATMRNADLADILALAGESALPASGALNFSARIAGTLGNPQGALDLNIVNGAAYGEPFDGFAMSAALSDQRVDLSSAQLVAGTNRLDLSGSFNHPRDSLTTGRVQFHVGTSPIQLNQLIALQLQRPGLSGIADLNADVAGDLQNSGGSLTFSPTAISAELRATAVRDRGQFYGNLSATARTNASSLDARLTSDFAGSTIELASRTQLHDDYSTTADATIRGLQVEKALAVAGLSKIRASGTLSLRAHAAGTLDDPHASVNFDLTKAVVYEEPLDRIGGQIDYTNQLVTVANLQLASPAGRCDLSGSLAHPPSAPARDVLAGHLDLHLKSSRIDLSRVHYIAAAQPGLKGTFQLAIDAAADLSKRNGEPRVLLSRLDTSGGVTGMEMNRQAVGNVTFESETHQNSLSFNLDSDVAKSSVHGNGQIRLDRDYPLDAKLTFSNVTYSGLQSLVGASGETSPGFDALMEGQVNLSGPAAQPKNLRGGLQISRLELTTVQPRSNVKTIRLGNQGLIVARLSGPTIQIQSARLTGKNTNIDLNGKVVLDTKSPLDFTVKGNTDLTLLQDLDREIYAGGGVALTATIRGALKQPQVSGKVELKNASFNMADLPNGISNANGVITLADNGATIQNLTAESGGGKVSLTGFANFARGAMNYNVRANATHVRSRYQGASVTGSASLSLTRTSQRSVLGGNVSIERIGYGAQTDIGSILSGSGPPRAASSSSTGLLAGTQLNIRIQSAPDVRFDTALAQGLEATVDLTLRGAVFSPGLVGRINITQGTLVFFGNQYTVNRGTIFFYNPFDIQPVLDVSLETSVKSVDVVLKLTGPINDIKLSYTSDPPLKFDDIVALLATGRTPPDATIAAHQPTDPQQSVGQMGESAVVSQAVASPVASRLQRVFGVTQLKIDPAFAAGSSLPQARVTLQQQVTPGILFTYTQDLSQSNSEILRVEWTMTPRFSAVAVRDENGIFGIDFFYKKRFR